MLNNQCFSYLCSNRLVAENDDDHVQHEHESEPVSHISNPELGPVHNDQAIQIPPFPASMVHVAPEHPLKSAPSTFDDSLDLTMSIKPEAEEFDLHPSPEATIPEHKQTAAPPSQPQRSSSTQIGGLNLKSTSSDSVLEIKSHNGERMPVFASNSISIYRFSARVVFAIRTASVVKEDGPKFIAPAGKEAARLARVV
jgi:hypothetical protein